MRIHYNDLPHAVRERIGRLLAEPKTSGAILMDPSGRGRWTPLWLGIPAAAGLAYAFNFVLQEAGHKAPYYEREVYYGMVGLWWLVLVCAATFIMRSIWKHPHFKAGSFIFPSYMVIAAGEELSIIPLNEIGKPLIVNRYKNGVYQGSRLELTATTGGQGVFHFSSIQAAEDAVMAFHQARIRMDQVVAARDVQTLQQIDPFFECTTSGQWTESPNLPKIEPIIDKLPKAVNWARWLAPIPLAIGFTAITYVGMLAVCESSPRAHDKYCGPTSTYKTPCCR